MFSLPERPLRVALYARVSTDEQAENDNLKPQIEFLQQWAALYKFEVAGLYIDDGVSGTIPLGDRPDGRRLLDDARVGRFEVVAFKRVDRFVRRAEVLTDAYKTLDALGVSIRSATEPFDTSTPMGRFIMQLLGSLAELDKESLLDRLTTGRDYKARDGKWQGGWIPYGYDLDADGRLVPSARLAYDGITEAEIIRDLYRRIADGSTLYAEAVRLNGLGVPAVRRGTNGHEHEQPAGWTRSRVTVLLHNPIYRGEGTLKSKRGTVSFTVPALVDAATWERAQQQLIQNRTFSRAESHERYLLRGLIRCAQCDRNYVGQFVDRKYRMYRCSTQHEPGNGRLTCDAVRLRAPDLEAAIWADCREFILNPADALRDAQQQLRARMERSAHAGDERRRLLQQIAEKDAERDRVMTLFRRNRMTLDEAERHMDEIAREAAQLRQLVEAINAQADLAAMFEAQVTEAGVQLARLHERLSQIEETDDFDAKRAIIELLVTDIRVATIWEDGVRKEDIKATFTLGGPPQGRAGENTSSCTSDLYVRPGIELVRAVAATRAAS